MHEPVHDADPHRWAANGVYTLDALDADGARAPLSKYAGKVTLFVNVASKCGFTDANYRGLKAVHDKYHAHGLEILAFPCNQFGQQEPGTLGEIKALCRGHYGAEWPLFGKVDVNGPRAHPVWAFLKRHLPASQGGGGGTGPGNELAWNFQKILVDRNGYPVRLHAQAWDQGAVEHDVYDLLTGIPLA